MNPIAYMTQNIEALRTELKVLAEYVSPRLEKQRDEEVEQTLKELPQILNDIETGSKHIRQVALGVRGHAQSAEESTEAELADVAGFAAKLARSEVKQRSKLAVDGPPVRIAGGPVQLCQVLLNLIVNAAQSLEGTARQGMIRVSWELEGDWVRLIVKDNGVGITPELQDKVFEPLFTTKAPEVGTGLGLSICKELVGRMGGEIKLHSTVGVGTTVELRLRRAGA
jgi:signal transduction histidine kinase